MHRVKRLTTGNTDMSDSGAFVRVPDPRHVRDYAVQRLAVHASSPLCSQSQTPEL